MKQIFLGLTLSAFAFLAVSVSPALAATHHPPLASPYQ